MSRVSDKDMNLGLICMDKIDNTYTDRKKTPLLRFIFILRILVLKFLVMLLNLVKSLIILFVRCQCHI